MRKATQTKPLTMGNPLNDFTSSVSGINVSTSVHAVAEGFASTSD